MKRLAAALPAMLAMLAMIAAALAAVSASATAASECGPELDARQRRVISTPRHELAFAPQPAPLRSGRHFALDIVICPRTAASLPLALRIDADMPAHRHGMNYRPTVRVLGEGRYRADGLLLHMPGRWRLLFELSADGRLERLSHELDIE